MFEVSWLAVIVGAVISFAVGALWYSPKWFGQKWMDAQPHRKESDYTGAGPAMILQVMFTLSLSVLIALLASALMVEGFAQTQAVGCSAILVGFVISTMSYAAGLFAGSSKTMIHINVGYDIVKVCIIGLTLIVL